jgi:GNAT superfamily N-acetyltransferase
MALIITRVQSRADKRAFYTFAWRVYRDDPNWVPHLWPQRKGYLDGKASFYEYGEGEFWLARRDGRVVGTIGTGINHARNAALGARQAIFGFFEVFPDGYEVAAALWDHACEWGRARGMDELHGPYNFAVNDDPGFLVQGFDTTPAIMMGHNPPYYPEFAERYGFHKFLGSMAYRRDLTNLGPNLEHVPPVLLRIVERARAHLGPDVIRTIRMADLDAELERIRTVYNKSLATLYGFSPLTPAETREIGEMLKPLADPELVFLAEMEGKTVGFALGLPNIQEALIHANGLRAPWDYLRLMRARHHITGASYKVLALDPDYWGRGIDALLYYEMGRRLIAKGYTWVDASLTGEDNPQTHRLATHFGAVVYRVYRQYWIGL